VRIKLSSLKAKRAGWLNPRVQHMSLIYLNIMLASVLSLTGSGAVQASLLNIFLLVDVVLSNLWLLIVLLPRYRVRLPAIYKAGMALILPSVVLNFAHIDLLISAVNPQSFNTVLTRTDALYFTVTTMSTVGFGDIHPVSNGAKLWICCQIVAGLVITVYIIGRAMSPIVTSRADATGDKETE
jgi:Ion channel